MKTLNILGGVLVLQLILALGLFWNDSRYSGAHPVRPLLDFDMARVDRMVVDDNLNQAVVERGEDGWVLPELHGLPGADARIDSLLDDLAGVRTDYPVATTVSARGRFEVAEDKFQRHVQFYGGGELLGEFYLGTSPALRQAHTRRAGEDEIYKLDISSFDFGGDNNDWMDKTLLAAGTPTRIEGPGFSLKKQDAGWQLNDLPAGEELAVDAVNELVDALSSLRVLRVADEEPPEAGVAVKVAGDKGSYEYRFAGNEEDNRYYVRRSDRDPWFTLGKVNYDRIALKTRESLLQPPPDAAPAEDDESEEETGEAVEESGGVS